MKLVYRLSNWGTTNLDDPDPARVLRTLHVEQKKTTSEMDNSFAIAQWSSEVWNLFKKIIDGDVEKQGKNLNFIKPDKIRSFRQLCGTLTEEEHIGLGGCSSLDHHCSRQNSI